MPELGVLDDINNLAVPIDTSAQDTIAASTANTTLPTADVSTYDPSGYDSTSYDATTKDLTGDQLVLDNVDKVLDKGGVLMDVARSTGDEYANSRGMLNSSMGAEASMRSMIDSALPIASQDASSQLSQLQTNQMYENQASEFGASAQNRASEFTASAENVAGQFNSTAQNDMARFNTTNEVQQVRDSILQSYQLQMENLSTNNKALLIDLEQKYAAAIQSDKNASDVYRSTMDQIGQLMSTADLTVDQQNAGMNELVSMLSAYLDFNVNLNSVNSVSGEATDPALPSDREDAANASATVYREEAMVKISEYDQKLGAMGPRPELPSSWGIGDLGEMQTIATNQTAWDAEKVALDSEYSSWLRYAENNPDVWG